MQKICCKCSNDLPLSSFHKNKTRKDGHSGICKECEKLYKKKYYKADPKKYKSLIKSRRNDIRDWYQDYKRKKKLRCVKCGISHIACLQFHHRDPSVKEMSVCDMVRRGWSIGRIIDEIENKCDVLCANCHFIHHYEEKSGPYAKG